MYRQPTLRTAFEKVSRFKANKGGLSVFFIALTQTLQKLATKLPKLAIYRELW
jgi:hypothetical protein